MTQKETRATLKRFLAFLETYSNGHNSKQAKHRAIFAAQRFAAVGVSVSARTLEGVLQRRFPKGPKPATIGLIRAGLNALESTPPPATTPALASNAPCS